MDNSGAARSLHLIIFDLLKFVLIWRVVRPHYAFRKLLKKKESFFIYKTLKQINKIPIEYRECVLPGKGHIFRHYERINFATKQLKLVKNPQRSNKNGYVINKY